MDLRARWMSNSNCGKPAKIGQANPQPANETQIWAKWTQIGFTRNEIRKEPETPRHPSRSSRNIEHEDLEENFRLILVRYIYS